MLSKEFPVRHPKAGQPTGFKEKKETGIKKHTIRENVELWEHRAKEINEGLAVLSVRQWSGKPYERGTHQIEIDRLTKIGIQRVFFSYEWHPVLQVLLPVKAEIQENDQKKNIELTELAANDGLILPDFRHWFASRKKNLSERKGVILHFTDMRY